MAGAPFGTDIKNVEAAELALGVQLPRALRSAFGVANKSLEIDADAATWFLYPVFDPERPSRTANHLVYENAPEQRWDHMPDNLLAIAHDGSGNHLVLVVEENRAAGSDVFVWDHETGELTATGLTAHHILDAAVAYAREGLKR